MTYLEARKLAVMGSKGPILDDVSVSLRLGEFVGLIGPNGAGKTTLVKSLLGLRQPSAGQVSLEGRHLGQWHRGEVAKRLGYLAQGAPCHWPVTVERVVALGRLAHARELGGRDANGPEVVRLALAATGMTGLKDRVVTSLSGGERTLAMIARCLAGGAPMILADEPVTGLDPRHQIEVMETLKARIGPRTGVVAVLHDLNLALRYCTRLILMDGGGIVVDGYAREVLSQKNLKAVYGIDADVHVVGGHSLVIPKDGDR
ncbi:MAG: ABC transporter ATP-binding protein [Gammaproteobacteria bacterium]